jgi:hypothetical protein
MPHYQSQSIHNKLLIKLNTNIFNNIIIHRRKTTLLLKKLVFRPKMTKTIGCQKFGIRFASTKSKLYRQNTFMYVKHNL